MSVFQFKVKKINGEETSLEEYKGKVLLIVNVASKCGLTPQYEGLQKLHREYQNKGLTVLGFPANEFLAQEPGTNQEILEFCTLNYSVDFPMFEKIVVKGEGQHPLYAYLTQTQKEALKKDNSKLMSILKEKGLLTGEEHDIKWNFEKFLVGKDGKIIARFAPDIDPNDPVVTTAVEKALALN